MNAHDYILSKQIQWAYRNNIILIGSKVNRGHKAYTQKLGDNLFEPLLPEVKGNFEEADGEELTGSPLIKHILGLKEKFGKNKFRLLYLWYDTIGPESGIHHKEIDEFTEITKADNIYFHAMSYQDLIIKLAKKYRETHRDYIDYIIERYL